MLATTLLIAATLGQTNITTSGTVTGITDPSGWCTDSPFIQVGNALDVSFTAGVEHEGFATLSIGPYTGVVAGQLWNGEVTLTSIPSTNFWTHPAIPWSALKPDGSAEILFAWDHELTQPPQPEYIDCTVTATIAPLDTRIVGDANGDGLFESSDLVQVFQAGEYEDSLARNSSWATGDWDANLDFNSGDLVVAFQAGAYEQPATAMPVPEPATVLLPSLLVLLWTRRWRVYPK